MPATNTLPTYTPGSFSSSRMANTILLNDLNNTDPAMKKELYSKYGAENYAFVLTMLLDRIKTVTTVENSTIRHTEDRNLMQSVKVQTTVLAGAAGAALTFVIASGDHYSSGTKSPIVEGKHYQIRSSGVQVKCTAKNISTASAHTATIVPTRTTDVITTGGNASLLAGDILDELGRVAAGEASGVKDGTFPIWDVILNTITQHRDDISFSDLSTMEKQQINIEGTPYYTMGAVDKMNRRYMNDHARLIFEGQPINNISGVSGTTGIIQRTTESGVNIQYTAGSMTFADIQSLTRQIKFYGGAGDYHMLCDQYQYEEFTSVLFAKFQSTFNNVNWESVGGSAEAAVAYGFDHTRVNGTNLFLKSNPMFNATQYTKRPSTVGTDVYKNFSQLIPQTVNRDAKTGEVMPSLEVVYQVPQGMERIHTWETGGLAAANKTDVMERAIHMISYPGVRVFGANAFASFKGVA